MTLIRKLISFWKKGAQKGGEVFSSILLFLIYFLFLCPWAFLSRIFGKKWLLLTSASASSNWLKKEDPRRGSNPYERLF